MEWERKQEELRHNYLKSSGDTVRQPTRHKRIANAPLLKSENEGTGLPSFERHHRQQYFERLARHGETNFTPPQTSASSASQSQSEQEARHVEQIFPAPQTAASSDSHSQSEQEGLADGQQEKCQTSEHNDADSTAVEEHLFGESDGYNVLKRKRSESIPDLIPMDISKETNPSPTGLPTALSPTDIHTTHDATPEPEERPKCECRCDCGHRPGKNGRRSCGRCNALVGPGCCWNAAQGLCHLCVKDEPDKGAGNLDLIEAQLPCDLQTCSCKWINKHHLIQIKGEKLPRCNECVKPVRSHSLVTGNRIEKMPVLVHNFIKRGETEHTCTAGNAHATITQSAKDRGSQNNKEPRARMLRQLFDIEKKNIQIPGHFDNDQIERLEWQERMRLAKELWPQGDKYMEGWAYACRAQEYFGIRPMVEENTHESIANIIWPLGDKIPGGVFPTKFVEKLQTWPHRYLEGIFDDDIDDAPPYVFNPTCRDSRSTGGHKPPGMQESRFDLGWPCVDCGRITGGFCDHCWAIQRMPDEEWPPWQRTPICTRCNDKRDACRFCLKMPPFVPSGHQNTSTVQRQSSDITIKARVSAIAMLKQDGKIDDPIYSGIDKELAEACHKELYKPKPILGPTTPTGCTWAESERHRSIQILRYTEAIAEFLNMWSRRSGWKSKLSMFEIEEIRAYCNESDEKDAQQSRSEP